MGIEVESKAQKGLGWPNELSLKSGRGEEMVASTDGGRRPRTYCGPICTLMGRPAAADVHYHGGASRSTTLPSSRSVRGKSSESVMIESAVPRRSRQSMGVSSYRRETTPYDATTFAVTLEYSRSDSGTLVPYYGNHEQIGQGYKRVFLQAVGCRANAMDGNGHLWHLSAKGFSFPYRLSAHPAACGCGYRLRFWLELSSCRQKTLSTLDGRCFILWIWEDILCVQR